MPKQPRLDLTDATCNDVEPVDFILATEVFEHIEPPVQHAFNNLARLLKPHGFVVFSTPWRPRGRTVEHFPLLHAWKLTQFDQEQLLINKTKEGKFEVFNKLIFHGGVGNTLEIRLFSKPSLEDNFRIAGLRAEWASESYVKYGIHFSKPWSIPCVVRKIDNSTRAAEVDDGATILPAVQSRQDIDDTETKRTEIEDLYKEIDSQTAYIQRMADQISALTARLQDACKQRDTLSADVKNSQEYLDKLKMKLSCVKKSAWLKLGRYLNLGPKLT